MKKELLLSWLVAATALVSCHKDHLPTEEVARRTVIVYMAAENNLSTYSRSDLSEIAEGSQSLTKDQHLVVFLDDASGGKPVLVEMKDGGRDTLYTYEHDFYSSDPDRFLAVIMKAKELRPAKSYGLVLWGHAKGWLVETDSVAATSRVHRAFGIDTGANLELPYTFGSRWMNITQLARALEKTEPFSFIFADCCCMMCVEVAYELRRVARFLIGSPAEIPGDGAPYHLLVKHMFGEGDDFCRDIVDAYYDYYLDRTYAGSSLPMSVVDLSEMENLAAATAPLLKPADQWDTEHMAYYYRDKNDSPVMYDMASLMERNLSADDYASWVRTALDAAVPYRRFSSRWMTDTWHFDVYKSFGDTEFSEENFAGLSMFVSKPEYNFSPNYDFNNTVKNYQWYWAVGWNRFEGL